MTLSAGPVPARDASGGRPPRVRPTVEKPFDLEDVLAIVREATRTRAA